MNRVWVVVVLSLFCFFHMLTPGTATAAEKEIPPDLQAWQPWVLHGQADRHCPSHYNDSTMSRCWWPSQLFLDVGDRGGLFDQQVTVYAHSWVTLPGDEAHWPESVSSGGNPVPVSGRNGRPHIWLEPGDYRIRGAFIWDPLPDILQVPAAIGIISLKIDDHEIAIPDLDDHGRLRFHGNGTSARRQDTMTATLFRLVEDDIPIRVTTRVMLQVAGRAREIRLAVRLPDRATVMKIDSPLPARLANNGDLLVQARPGRWDIRIMERLMEPVKTLTSGDGSYGDEIWSFRAINDLRMVKVSGAPPLEPSRTRMPEEWKNYPAYQLGPDSSLSFEVIRRGDPDPAPDQLRLERSWWLDFDGKGFTVHDRINGTLNRTWHLAMPLPMELGRVSVDGQDQLITLQGDNPSPGVQLRRGRLSLAADSRLPRTSSSLPAIGWDHDFQQVGGILHLPPGWTLFSAGGVDIPSGAWLQQWTLLDFFLVLIIAISTYKLRTPKTAGLILVTLCLIFHEPGAPRHVWLHLLAVTALLTYLPSGWFKRLVKLWGIGTVVALIIIIVPFAVQQVRNAVYPQLAQGKYGIGYQLATPGANRTVEADRAAAPEPALMSKRMGQTAEKTQLSEQPATSRTSRFATDPDALIQTGPGLPSWRWRTVQLHWNGPVDRNQQIRLWLISPFKNLLLGLVRVGLLLLSIGAFLNLHNWRRHLPAPLAAGTSMLALLVVFLAPLAPLRAETTGSDFPPQVLLEELQRRLLEPPPCMPHCADVSRLELAATPDQLRLIMQAHAQVDTAIPLPVSLETWRPTQLTLNNEPVNSLARDDQGNLWMVLPQGVHRIKMTGPTGGANEIRIAFPIVPHMGTYAGVGWQARGFRPDSSMEATIALNRVEKSRGVAAASPTADVPAFFHVSRTLHLGIQWEVTTRIRRLTSPGTPAMLSIPLLKNASLTTAGIQVTNGKALISMGPEEKETRISTTLPVSPSIQLTAPQDKSWTETWILDAAAMWRCTVSGLTVVHHRDAAQNWQPQWRPWPGEQVSIAVARPKAVPGRTITIDSARLALTPGQRFSRAVLDLGIRSSKGGHHQIELPDKANLQAVTVNSSTLPIRQDGQLVNIPLEPGTHNVGIQWLQLNDSMNLIKAPRIHVGDAAVNAAVTFHMPGHRWILLAGGPRLGPAVLFWSYVIVVLAAAVGLGRTDITPLRTRHWVLLGLGLTQVPAVIAVLVVGWLLALGYCCRMDGPTRPLAFNFVQVLLVVITLAALAGLYTAIERGLLGIPDMQIAGNHSTQFQLNWNQDRIEGTLPTPWVLSLPQWTYHLLMLAWSLWLAFSLITWLRWGWGCFARQGLWKPIRWRWNPKRAKSKDVQPAKEAQPSAQADSSI